MILMDKTEIIERLGEIAKHAVHTIGEEPFIMSLDDGTAVYEAIDIIQQSQPQRTGRWHVSPNGYFYRCQYCGKSRDRSDARFCWYCGARMEGES